MITLQKNLFEGNFPLSQRFGENPDWYARFGMKGHNGIDYALPNGTKLYSCLFGTVTEFLNDTQGYGLYVKIENDECGVIYAHMQKSLVKVGDFVEPGRLLGYSNNTGNSTGPHLHFGVFPKPRDRGNGYAGYIDPLNPNNIEWVAKLERPDEIVEPECEMELADMRKSRDGWKQKAFDLEGTLALERKEHKNEIDAIEEKLAQEISQIEHTIETYDAIIGELEKQNKRIPTLDRKVLDLKGQLVDCKKHVCDDLSSFTWWERFTSLFRIKN